MTASVASTEPKRKGPSLRVSVVTLIVGVVIAIPGIVVFGIGFWHSVFGPTYDAPGTTQLHLQEGRYVIFENTAKSRSYGVVTITDGRGISIDASHVTITGEDGRPVAVQESPHNQSINRMSDHYVSAVEFSTPRAGDYVMRIDSDVTTEVMVGPPLSRLLRPTSWFASTGAGWLIAVIGAGMIIVGSTRRNHAARIAQSQTTSPLPSAQWYPDPLGERRLRYWDGWHWTDHTAD